MIVGAAYTGYFARKYFAILHVNDVGYVARK